MSTETNNKSWAKLGTIRKRKTKSGADQSYIILDKQYKVIDTKTGKEVDLGEYRQIKLIKPQLGLNTRLERGSISQEDFNKQISFIEEKGVIYELSVPPNDSGLKL